MRAQIKAKQNKLDTDTERYLLNLVQAPARFALLALLQDVRN